MSSRWDNVLSGWRLATGCLQMPARVAAHVPQAKLAENIGSLFGLLAWAPEHPVGGRDGVGECRVVVSKSRERRPSIKRQRDRQEKSTLCNNIIARSLVIRARLDCYGVRSRDYRS